MTTQLIIAQPRIDLTVVESVVTLDIRRPGVTLEIATTGPQGPPGPQGSVGPQGALGPPGPGVPAGGAAGDLLFKASAADYAATWLTPPYLTPITGDARYYTQDQIAALLASYTPTVRQLTINGVAFDLSANRAWTLGDLRSDASYNDPSWLTGLAWAKLAGIPSTFAPSAHAASHAAAGSDALTPAAIGAVPIGRTLTINGVALDLSADRSWSITAGVSSVAATSPLASSGGSTPTISLTGQVAPANGGTGAANSGNLTWPNGGGTAALLATANTFTNTQIINAGGSTVFQVKSSNPSWTGFQVENTAAGGRAYAFRTYPTTGAVPGGFSIIDATFNLTVWTIDAATSSFRCGIGRGNTSPTAQLDVLGFNANEVVLKLKQAANPSVDAVQLQDSAANVLHLISNIGAALFRPRDTATSTVTTALTTGHATSGTPAASYGVRHAFTLQSSTTADRSAADWTVLWGDATDATRKARVVGTVYDHGGAREWIRGEASGSAPMIGFLGAAATARESVAADATDLASAIALANDLKAKLVTKGLVA